MNKTGSPVNYYPTLSKWLSSMRECPECNNFWNRSEDKKALIQSLQDKWDSIGNREVEWPEAWKEAA